MTRLWTVVGVYVDDGSPFVQTFPRETARDAVLAVHPGRVVQPIAVFEGVQIPDESWRPDSGQAQTYDGEIYEPQRVG